MKIKKIYFDLDGVLADFDKGIRELCGVEPRGQGWEEKPEEEARRWEKMREVDHFYDKLDVYPGAKEMFDTLYERYGDACEILSAIPKASRGMNSSFEDKTKWVRRLISEDVVINLVYRDDKISFCEDEECILIDDYHKNINEWLKQGGTGILFSDPKEVVERILTLEKENEDAEYTKIEILDEHDPSSYFVLVPAVIDVSEEKHIRERDASTKGDAIYVEESYVEVFLRYFLYKYFEDEMFYNKYRYDDCEGYIKGFVWWLTFNYYTYDSITAMCDEMEELANYFEEDYDDPRLNEIKEDLIENGALLYICDDDNPDQYAEDKYEALRRHIRVVIGFYRRFSAKMRKMMKKHPEAYIIVVEGP